jgi:hypothetical protein
LFLTSNMAALHVIVQHFNKPLFQKGRHCCSSCRNNLYRHGKTSIALSWCNVFIKSIVFFCHPIYCVTCDWLYFYEYITSSACHVGSPCAKHVAQNIAQCKLQAMHCGTLLYILIINYIILKLLYFNRVSHKSARHISVKQNKKVLSNSLYFVTKSGYHSTRTVLSVLQLVKCTLEC